MTYFTSMLIGIITALLAVVIVVFAMVRVEMSEGSGAMFISISSWQILVAAFVGFVAGFWFSRRRSRARPA
jgi:hypothetical protein